MHRILIELEGSDEPAWTYLEYQHAHILDTMRAMHSKSLERVKCESTLIKRCRFILRIVATRSCAEQPSSSNSHIETLKRQLAMSQYSVNPANRKLFFPVGAEADPIASAVEVAWMEIDKMVKSQSDYVARSLSGFWKIAKACMDGKYRKVRLLGGVTHR